SDFVSRVSRHVALLKIVAQNWANSQCLDRVQVGNNLSGALEGVVRFHFRRGGRAVDQRVIKDSLYLSVMVESANMIRGCEPQALIGLRHQVAYVDLHRGRIDNRVRDTAYQQIRDETGKQ